MPQTRVFITISLRLQKRPDKIFFLQNLSLKTWEHLDQSGGHDLFLILMFIQVLFSPVCREAGKNSRFFNAKIFFRDTSTHTVVDAK